MQAVMTAYPQEPAQEAGRRTRLSLVDWHRTVALDALDGLRRRSTFALLNPSPPDR